MTMLIDVEGSRNNYISRTESQRALKTTIPMILAQGGKTTIPVVTGGPEIAIPIIAEGTASNDIK